MSMVLNSLQLRALAEWASGYRGEVVDFYETADHQIGLWRRSQGDCPYPVILSCDTPFVVSDRPAVAVATLGTAEDSVDLLKIPVGMGQTVAADAVFWSESSVEKFLFPYYAGKGSWAADLYADALRTVFYGPRAIAWYGDAEEQPGDFVNAAQLDVQTPQEETMVEEPFGLVHIPKSDYIPVDQEQAAAVEARALPPLATGGELGVLVRHRVTRKVRVRMLEEMVRELKRGRAARAQPAR